MFATAITASRLSQPDICSRSRPLAVVLSVGLAGPLFDRHRVDRVHQLSRGSQPFDHQPIRGGRHTAVGPFLSHGDPPPPLNLTHEVQTSALVLRKQHGQALSVQWMERVSDHQ
jgi:hypothetical protein